MSEICLQEVLAQLYADEINFSVSVFWDGGYDCSLGDEANGIRAKANFDNLLEAAVWFQEEADKHWPGRLLERLDRGQREKTGTT